MAEIVIGGDLCPINRNLPLFLAGDAQGIFNDLLPEFHAADLSIVNLECPLIAKPSPIRKSGPVLGADRAAVIGLSRAGIRVASLANNHILDHGAAGVLSTLDACAAAGVATVGAGRDLRQAGEMLLRDAAGVRVGILSYAEREFSIAGRDRAGANPLELASFFRSIRAHQGAFDYLIVLLHGGLEHYPFPSPRLQDTCRLLVEEGAHAVICQHSHCPGCYEAYRGGHIVYGQGNLIFDRYPDRGEQFYLGYLVKLSLTPGRDARLALIPYRQSDARAGARKMAPPQAASFLGEVEKRSLQLADAALVLQNWRSICLKKKNSVFSVLRGHSRVLRYLNRLAPFVDKLYGEQNLLTLHNLVRCESHREVLETLLCEMQKQQRKGG